MAEAVAFQYRIRPQDRTLSLTIALDGKRGPPVRRLPKDVELVEQAAPPPPKLEPQCVNCGAVATLKCSACAAVGGVAGARPQRGAGWRGRVAKVLVGNGRGRYGCGEGKRAELGAFGGVRGRSTVAVEASGARHTRDRADRAFALATARRSGGRYTSPCAAIGRR